VSADSQRPCPLESDGRRAAALSRGLLQALRRLSRDLRACRCCPASAECLLRRDLPRQVDAALSELSREWRLGE